MIFKFCPLCASPMKPYREDGFPREKCTQCGFVHYHNSRATVSGLLVKDEKILLCHRAHEPFKGTWDIPGGYMEEKESPLETLQREMKEELGIDVRNPKFLTVSGPTYYPFDGQKLYNTDIFYVVEPIGEPKAVAGSDVAAIDWFLPDNLPDLAFASNAEAIKMWQNLAK